MKIEFVSISEIASVISGQSPPSSTYNDVGEGLPFYQGKTDFGDQNPIPRKWCSEPKRIAEKNDILLSVRAPVGPVNIAIEKSAIGRGLAAIRMKNNNDYRYLYYYLKSNPLLISRYSTGSTFSSISRKDIDRISIPVPKESETQKRIAKVLSDCEVLIAKRKESIELLDELLKSTFLEMFGGVLNNSKNWPTTNFENIIRLKRGYDLPKRFRKKGVYPLFASNGELDRISDFKVRGPGIVTGRSGTLGKVNYVNEDYWPLNTTLYSEELKAEPVYTKFLLEFYRLERFSKGAGVPTLNRNLVHREAIIDTPKDLQIQFSKIVGKVESIKQLYQMHLQDLENLYGSLSQKAFKGELDVSKVLIRETGYFSSDPDETPEDFMKWAEEKLKEKESKGSGEEVSNEQIKPDDITAPKAQLIGKSKLKVIKWSEVSSEKIARLIKKRYSDKHFTLEMLQNFLENKKHIQTEYFTSEELKKKPALNSKQDLKKFIFSSIEPQDPKNPNPFLSLEQHFYDSIKENFVLKILSSDYKFYKEKDEKQRAGIYFSINK